ncbi:MAG: hypothetical protein U0N59_04195, partial [Oscillospiraceae bacterium]
MDLCDRNDIQALLARHGFHFAKALGQNFLIRGDVAEDIAAAFPDIVLEGDAAGWFGTPQLTA